VRGQFRYLNGDGVTEELELILLERVPPRKGADESEGPMIRVYVVADKSTRLLYWKWLWPL